YSRIRGERAENLEQAIAAYEQALTVFQPEMLPDDCRRTARNLGHVRAETGNWKAAAVAYDLALQAAEVLYKEAASHFGKEAELSANSDLFRRAAYALAHTAEPSAYRRAGEVAESGRARGLGETLARDRSDLSEIERDYPETYERYRAAAEQVRLFEQAARADERRTGELPPGIRSEDLVRRIVAAREQLDAAIEAIRALPGYDGFLRPLTYAEIVATARPGVPLVYLITTPQGSLALIVPFGADEPEALQLDDFTETDLDGLLIKRESNEVVGGYLPGQLTGGAALTTALAEGLPLLGAALAAPLAARLRELHATGVTLVPTGLLSLLPLHAATYTVDGQTRCLLDEFDVAYAPSARVLATAQREQQRRAGGALRLAGVGNPLPSLETGAWAQRELAHALPGINKHGAVVLPRLEAAARQAAPKTREQLENLADLWRASLRRLEELAHQPPEQIVKAGHDLALAAALFADLPDDAGKPLAAIAARIPPSLTYARSELISILDLLPPGAGTPLYEQQATRAAFWAGLQGATIAHLACHGRFGIEDTLESALLLAGDTRLTLRELVTGDTTALAHVRLAVLSACQTAIIDFRRVPDESIGLPGGFLQAGVPAVVGSLWSVNDLSTALLMHRFYELYLKGDTGLGLAPQAPARALRLAQQWLRSLTNEAMFAYFERHRQLKEAQRVPGVERMPLDLIAAGRDRAEEGILLESPAHQPYADPIYWAAFAVHGALEV
ncbi:CHAT domain-containing protein, partial [Candidatus Chloroploca sp. Khr17]|uniref:CHAT domain-containing protein n=1 Tax=Candidatus Chloroploca sp. Khr17 TaxID=2496869 RepID=UPI0013EDE617